MFEDGVQLFLCRRLAGRLRHARVDHLRNRFVIVKGYENIRGLEIAMNDALLVGVLDRMANRHEYFEALP